ncbi:unannotated protein [freshwater metagenome]|uniref:Unannotated protein n=1 Tax=freshwater metagenome TaxID=449393 RepID=A0A6J7T8J6_9ZZZZ|nr:hypothetical protein [Actinomycetota bacterium]MSW57619.1 hypothetical protein [Actinomycetota bacterium]MSX49069.1 hypothetical protein [Actinomycetota bacterium]MSY10047.1 hypothetical protein [Actinomycetota bacterium]MSY55232.1 hypothetical protein [Actinomycetota bacterium]
MKSKNQFRSIVRFALALGLGAMLLAPSSASAMTKFQGGPLSNLNPTSDTVHIALSNFPSTGGLYVLECLRTASAGSLATSCDTTNQLWVSYDAGASVSPIGDVALKVTGTVAGTTCGADLCAIFLTYDHTKATDRTEDQLVNISFRPMAITVIKPTDAITASVNNSPLSKSVPGTLAYRTPLTIKAASTSGSIITIKSSTPDCTVVKNVITALKATGYCDFSITSEGNLSYQGVTSHYPFALTTGIQQIRVISKSVKVDKRYFLPAKSNFGNRVLYTSTTPSICSIKSASLTALKAGSCEITATAAAQGTLWSELSSKITIKII